MEAIKVQSFILSTAHEKFHQIFTLIGSFCWKCIKFQYRGIMSHETEEWCKIWRKTDLWFRKWHEEFGKVLPERSKVSKLGLWWNPFIQSRKYMSLKLTEELCVMIMKNDAKFEEELTDMSFQNWHEEFEEFWNEYSKISKIFTLMHSTINNTFHTCSTESLFLRYKKIPKKAFK